MIYQCKVSRMIHHFHVHHQNDQEKNHFAAVYKKQRLNLKSNHWLQVGIVGVRKRNESMKRGWRLLGVVVVGRRKERKKGKVVGSIDQK